MRKTITCSIWRRRVYLYSCPHCNKKRKKKNKLKKHNDVCRYFLLVSLKGETSRRVCSPTIKAAKKVQVYAEGSEVMLRGVQSRARFNGAAGLPQARQPAADTRRLV